MQTLILSEVLGIPLLTLISLGLNFIFILTSVILAASSLTRRYQNKKHVKVKEIRVETTKQGTAEIVKNDDGTIAETHKSRRTDWWYRLIKSAEGVTIRYEDSNGNVLNYAN